LLLIGAMEPVELLDPDPVGRIIEQCVDQLCVTVMPRPDDQTGACSQLRG
jgi:hypothetical protein